MKIYSLFFFVFVLSFFGCSTIKYDKSKNGITNDFAIRDDFKAHFDSCGVEGSIVVYDLKNKNWIVSDTVGIQIETLPASTFKIINLLIALETNTIKDENEVLKWDGISDTLKYGYRPEIYHDMSAKEAFELSAVWVYVDLAKKIGKDRYFEFLSKCNYGNINLSEENPDFWNFGSFGISPIGQAEFLKSLYEETLPFSKRNINIVKNVMLTEQTENYAIHAKTGWTRDSNRNIGWWTGYVETKNGSYIFSTRILQDLKYNRLDFGNCRKEITKKALKALEIID